MLGDRTQRRKPMATQNGRTQFPEFVKDTLGEAQKRLVILEKEAQKRLVGLEKDAQKFAKEFVTRSRAAQKDFSKEIERFQKRGVEFIENPRVEKFAGRARVLSTEIASRLEELQTSVLNLVGVASKEQVESVTHELRRLSKKVEAMTKTARRGKAEPLS
jgi:hypothetical protein